MEIPKAKDVMAHAFGINDRRARLRYIEIQMDAATALNAQLWALYSLAARDALDPLHEAASAVLEFDWSGNDDDAVEAISDLKKAAK